MVAELLKKQYAPCEPIVLSDIHWPKLNSGAVRQAFKRLSDKGVLNRYMNGVYYFPEKDKRPSVEAVISKMYLENKEEIYGYYAGYAYGRELGVTKKEDKHSIIVTNKENSRGRYRLITVRKVYLRKPYTIITKDNVEAMALLDFIREWEMYSDLSEEDTFLRVKEYLRMKKINRTVFLETAVRFPSKVSALIVKHKLVRI